VHIEGPAIAESPKFKSTNDDKKSHDFDVSMQKYFYKKYFYLIRITRAFKFHLFLWFL